MNDLGTTIPHSVVILVEHVSYEKNHLLSETMLLQQLASWLNEKSLHRCSDVPCYVGVLHVMSEPTKNLESSPNCAPIASSKLAVLPIFGYLTRRSKPTT